jgi:hypothetical protein
MNLKQERDNVFTLIEITIGLKPLQSIKTCPTAMGV